jgi:hypothetical protein
MISLHRPVLIKETGKVGVTIDKGWGIWLVQVGDYTFGCKDDELEPLYTTAEIAAVYVTEVDEDGEEVDLEETQLESLVKPFGYSSDDLANFTEELIHKSVSRIRGVGNQQYSEGEYQKFEAMDIDDLFECVNEELFDIVNYAAMLFIRLERLRRGFKLGEGDDVDDEGEEEAFEDSND